MHASCAEHRETRPYHPSAFRSESGLFQCIWTDNTLSSFCCPRCPNKRRTSFPVLSSPLPPTSPHIISNIFLQFIPPSHLLSLSPPHSLTPLSAFTPHLPPISNCSSDIVFLVRPSPRARRLLQVFSVCYCGTLGEWLNHRTWSVLHGPLAGVHPSQPNAAGRMTYSSHLRLEQPAWETRAGFNPERKKDAIDSELVLSFWVWTRRWDV